MGVHKIGRERRRHKERGREGEKERKRHREGGREGEKET